MKVEQRLEAIFCDHSQMAECHEGCGHFKCPCGITWDEGYEGSFDDWSMWDDVN